VRLPHTRTGSEGATCKSATTRHKAFVSSFGEGARAGRDCAAFKKTRCDDSIASTAKHHTGEGEKDDCASEWSECVVEGGRASREKLCSLRATTGKVRKVTSGGGMPGDGESFLVYTSSSIESSSS
jgi:hypothetical protein